jgi:trans-aconitate methyltransferase
MAKLDPKHYDEHSSFQKSVAMEIMNLFPPASTDIILDMGCGDGFLSARLAEIVDKGCVVGIDPSEDMIHYATKTYHPINYPNLTFKIGQAESNHGEQLYSLITAFNCLHWSHNLAAVFKNCFNALKSDGKFLGVTYPKESPYWRIFMEVFSYPRWQKYLSISPASSWLSSARFKTLALENRFEPLLFKTEECLASYSCRQALCDYIKGWLPCLLPIGEKEQGEFLLDALDYAECQFKNKDVIELPYTKLTFCFVKK